MPASTGRMGTNTAAAVITTTGSTITMMAATTTRRVPLLIDTLCRGHLINVARRLAPLIHRSVS